MPSFAVPGPCHFCASIGAPCHLDAARRRQRPYYRVSEEEFRYMMRILEHFVPNTDFNLHTLKALAESLTNNGSENSQASPQSDAVVPVNGSSPGMAVQRADVHMGDAMDATVDEIEELHKGMGWLRVDSNGVYRYIGANSTYLFMDAVRTIKRPPLDTSSPKSEVLAPLTAADHLPPPTPETTQRLKAPRQINLPRRDLCDGCIARFFKEIQSVYWFFSAEQLHAHAKESPSLDTRPSLRYLALAKALVPALCDTGDVDSLRALCLLALALSSSMFGNIAYIYVGSAARIAFTLGLHTNGDASVRHSLHKQVDLRLFCSLYLLDLDISLCYGHPTAISEDIIPGVLKLPSEDILSPGSNMPLDYLEVSCRLAQLTRSLSRVRSVAVLHLRYWRTVMFATRPFLLHNVLRGRKLSDPIKQKWFDEFSNTCVGAGQKALDIIAFCAPTTS
ncbi:unnamed protein product [Parascedosporium putredinis]|uniref:Xylanolytic transcriptional activator regulatory domain-containing protein n=1 Tax=Parascedosporium putredinis TaxID=1442378 RepID=A0A9P1H292_9PEZI|nr:unnamed protein product [Parascedosporium putredinis]CAI7993432.1 unnamed protein product [Parascedosporium putredinis]